VDKEYREKMDLMKISDDRKEYLYTVRPEHDMGLSGWTSNGYFRKMFSSRHHFSIPVKLFSVNISSFTLIASLVSKCPPGMEAMVPLALFFISKAGGTFNTSESKIINVGLLLQ